MPHFYALASPRNSPVVKIGSLGFRAKNGRGRQSNHLLKGQFEIFRRPPRKMVGTTAARSRYIAVDCYYSSMHFCISSNVVSQCNKAGGNCNNMHFFSGQEISLSVLAFPIMLRSFSWRYLLREQLWNLAFVLEWRRRLCTLRHYWDIHIQKHILASMLLSVQNRSLFLNVKWPARFEIAPWKALANMHFRNKQSTSWKLPLTIPYIPFLAFKNLKSPITMECVTHSFEW